MIDRVSWNEKTYVELCLKIVAGIALLEDNLLKQSEPTIINQI